MEWRNTKSRRSSKQFSDLIKQTQKERRSTNALRRRRLTDQHINWIQNYMKDYSHQPVTRQKLKIDLEHQFPEAQNISLSTIGRCLKTPLQMSYKKLEKKSIPCVRPENIRKFFESSLLMLRLDQNNVELIYFDEFSVNTRHSSFKGWIIKGSKGYIKTHNDSFTMSFIWALSKTKIYGILGSSGTINAKILQYFIEQMITQRNQNSENLYRPFALVMDNASVHVSSSMQTFYKSSKLKVITIPPYSPSLNPTEKLIGSIKAHILKEQAEGWYKF